MAKQDFGKKIRTNVTLTVWFLSQVLNWELTTHWQLSLMELGLLCHQLGHTQIDLSSYWMKHILVRHKLPKDIQIMQVVVKIFKAEELRQFSVESIQVK